MILGLISLILAAVQRPISYICVPTKAADFMLPCSKVQDKKNSSSSGHCAARVNALLTEHLILYTYKFKASCEKRIGLQGMVSLVSQQGIHQLHIFIFVLAVVHVLCGVVTMILGRAKVFSNYLDTYVTLTII